MATGPNRSTQPQRVVLRIDEIDLPNRSVTGRDKTNVLVVATFRESAAGILHVPAQNERWLAQREGMGQWRLIGRLDSADQQAWAEANLGPGDIKIEGDNIWFVGTLHGVSGGGGTAHYQENGILVGTEPALDFEDSATLAWTVLDDAGSTRVKVSGTVLGAPPTGSAGGDLTGTYPNPTLVATGPGATGPLGDATHVSIVTIDAKGRVTGLTSTTITGVTPGGSAGGDLTGSYPNPTLAAAGPGATGPIGSATIVPIVTIDSKGRVTALTSTTITGVTPGGSAGGDLTGSYPNPTINTGAVTSAKILDGTITTSDLAFTPIKSGDAAGGDLTGTYPNPTLVATGPGATGPLGDAAHTPVITIDAKGRVTGLTSAAITASEINAVTISQTTHGFSVGQVLRYNSSTHLYVLALADSADDAEVVGIVSSVPTSGTFVLVTNGQVTLSGLVEGTTYFLDPSTPGALTATEPTTTGQISKPLLVAVSTTVAYFYNFRGDVIPASSTASGGVTYITAQDATVSANAEQIFDEELEIGSSFVYEIASGGILQVQRNNLTYPSDFYANKSVQDNPILITTNRQILIDDVYEINPEVVVELEAGEGLQPDNGAVLSLLTGSVPSDNPVFTTQATAPALAASGLTGATAVSRYAGATTSGPPVSGNYAIGDWVIDQSGGMWICTVAGNPGTWIAVDDAGRTNPVLRGEFGGSWIAAAGSGSAFCNMDSTPKSPGTLGNQVLSLMVPDTEDVAPTGYKTQFKIKVVYTTNTTSPAVTAIWALWEITGVSGGAGGYTETGGGSFTTISTGSVAINLATLAQANGAWVDSPLTTGHIYGYGVNLNQNVATSSALRWRGGVWRRWIKS